jgi:hypothetical protein
MSSLTLSLQTLLICKNCTPFWYRTCNNFLKLYTLDLYLTRNSIVTTEHVSLLANL